MKFIDTNILVLFALKELVILTDYEESLLKEFKELSRSQRFFTDFIITEFSIIMSKVAHRKYNLDQSVVVNALKEILIDLEKMGQFFSPNEILFTKAMNIYCRQLNSKNSLQDILLIECAKSQKSGILTADKNLLKAYNLYN